jgi:hypothetical protein
MIRSLIQITPSNMLSRLQVIIGLPKKYSVKQTMPLYGIKFKENIFLNASRFWRVSHNNRRATSLLATEFWKLKLFESTVHLIMSPTSKQS